MSKYSVRLDNLDGRLADIVVSRQPRALNPVWLVYYDEKIRRKILLCQVQNNGRFGWTVVVAGDVQGPRLVRGFKARWQAIEYAVDIREDLNKEYEK